MNRGLLKTANYGSFIELKDILEKGVKFRINEALEDCCKYGFLEKANLLIEYGAKATFKNSTPLRNSCIYSESITRRFGEKTFIQLIELLLQNGANSMAGVWGDNNDVQFNNPFSWLAVLGQTCAMRICCAKNKIPKEFIEKAKERVLENLPPNESKSLQDIKSRAAIALSYRYLSVI